MATQINREFSLVAACCLWPPSQQRSTAIAEAAAPPIDWTRFARIVRRHRVPGLAWRGLVDAGVRVPPEIAQHLKAAAATNAQTSLLLCAETIRLQRAFDAAGQSSAFIKGASLARLAYGDVGIRHAKDIDMIVPEAGLLAACDLLSTMGYRRIRPRGSLTATQLALWHRYGKDIVWRHGASNIELELHWRLAEETGRAQSPVDFSALYLVKMNQSATLATLPPAQLFDYLCAHGAVHGWMRLKWLADINALLSQPASADLMAYMDRARARDLGAVVGPAILLCRQLFGLRVPAALTDELRASAKVTRLARLAHFLMTRGDGETEIYDQAFGTTLVSLFHLLMVGSARAALTEIWRKSINLDDIEAFALPPSLGFLYPFLRWPLWIHRRMAHALASVAK